jgi:DNA replication protein DnaC
LLEILQAMRLRGIAEELPALLEEAAKEGWGQIDLLLEIFGREDVRRTQRRFATNLKASNLDECYGLDHFDFDLARAHGLEESVVRDLTQCEFVRAHRNVIIGGGVGTGKTFLARTLGVEALKRGFRAFFYRTGELLNALYKKRDSFQFGRIYGRLRDADLLVLDDLAHLSYSAEKVEFLFSLVVDRYDLDTGATIITSTSSVEEWWQFFPSKGWGMAFSDRLLDRAQGIWLTGESIRKTRSKLAKRPRTQSDEES